MKKQGLFVEINTVPFAFGKEGVQDRQNYLAALQAEIEATAEYSEDYEVEAVNITGINPLQYPSQDLTGILEKLHKALPFSSQPEVTINLKPGSATYGDMYEFQLKGVNRVSFDMGSFVQTELDTLGRTYAARAIEVFMRMVQLKLVFFNYDVTLFYGLPGQTIETLSHSIEQAIRFMAMHITLRPHPAATRDTLVQHYDAALDTLGMTSYGQYTLYHFARHGYTSIWNRRAYQYLPRLGFGVGAVSRIDGVVTFNTPDVAAYVKAKGDPAATICQLEAIAPESIMCANLLDGLFSLQVVDLSTNEGDLMTRVDELVARGLLKKEGQYVSLSNLGKADWQSVFKILNG